MSILGKIDLILFALMIFNYVVGGVLKGNDYENAAILFALSFVGCFLGVFVVTIILIINW